MRNSKFYVQRLGMQAHPEGGWFRETYRSQASIPNGTMPEFDGERNMATGIYFLLTKDNFSAFHRIKSDEMWHFYDGDGLVVHEIKPDGSNEEHRLGLNLDKGERPQLVIAANSWFASEVANGGSWCLVGCTVSPGFDFQDFELANRERLKAMFPVHVDIIYRLTRS